MFPHPYKKYFVSLSHRCGISQSTPLGSLASSLIRRLVSGSDTICNRPSLSLANIVRFGLLRINVNFMVLKRVCQGEFSKSLQEIFRSPLQPMWDLTIHPLDGPMSSLTQRPISGFGTICNRPSLPLVNIVYFSLLRIGVNFMVLKRVCQGEFSKPLQEIFRSPLQPMWDLTIHPLDGPTSSLTHRPISGFDTICNCPSLPLANIVRFSLLRIGVNFMILKRVCQGEFSKLL